MRQVKIGDQFDLYCFFEPEFQRLSIFGTYLVDIFVTGGHRRHGMFERRFERALFLRMERQKNEKER